MSCKGWTSRRGTKGKLSSPRDESGPAVRGPASLLVPTSDSVYEEQDRQRSPSISHRIASDTSKTHLQPHPRILILPLQLLHPLLQHGQLVLVLGPQLFPLALKEVVVVLRASKTSCQLTHTHRKRAKKRGEKTYVPTCLASGVTSDKPRPDRARLARSREARVPRPCSPCSTTHPTSSTGTLPLTKARLPLHRAPRPPSPSSAMRQTPTLALRSRTTVPVTLGGGRELRRSFSQPPKARLGGKGFSAFPLLLSSSVSCAAGGRVLENEGTLIRYDDIVRIRPASFDVVGGLRRRSATSC